MRHSSAAGRFSQASFPGRFRLQFLENVGYVKKLAWRREQGNEASSKAARQNPERKVRVRGKGGNTPRSEVRKETAMSQ